MFWDIIPSLIGKVLTIKVYKISRKFCYEISYLAKCRRNFAISNSLSPIMGNFSYILFFLFSNGIANGDHRVLEADQEAGRGQSSPEGEDQTENYTTEVRINAWILVCGMP
jgi:hypothetical protein